MVRHTHRRRQSRGRRRNTRRSRRTQRGGGSIFGIKYSSVTEKDIMEIQDRLNKASSPEDKAKIQKELDLAQAEKTKEMKDANSEKEYKQTGVRIEAGGATLSSTGVNNRSSDGRFQSPAATSATAGYGTGTGAAGNMFLGGRRKSRRYRRR